MRLARETGGRFAEANLDTDLDKEAVLRWFLAPLSRRRSAIAYHGAIHDGWALQWELRPRLSAASQPVMAAVARERRASTSWTRAASSPAELLQAAGALPRPRGRFSLGVRPARSAPRPLDGYVLDEREPSLVAAALARADGADPVGPAQRLGHLGVAHDARPARGRAAERAQHDRRAADRAQRGPRPRRHGIGGPAAGGAARRASTLHRTAAVRGGHVAASGPFTGRGARRSFTLFFVAGNIAGDARFTVHAKVSAPPRLSGLPAAPENLEIARRARMADQLLAPGADLQPGGRLPEAARHRGPHRRLEPGAAPDRRRRPSRSRALAAGAAAALRQDRDSRATHPPRKQTIHHPRAHRD